MNTVDTLQELKDRFESVNTLILTHQNFDDEARNVAAYHSASYMLNLTKMIENCDGQLTEEAMPVVNDVVKFLDLVEEHCTDLVS